jgi:hypothetical protein
MPPRIAPLEPTLDHSSPYYVHPGDGPSSVTVAPPLTGSNYHSWSRSMKRALGAKLKLDFIDGFLLMHLIHPFVLGIAAISSFLHGS